MLLLQFSTSHYCRKARLALGFKGIDYTVENLTPGLHALKLKPLTGLTTVPVLLPQMPDSQASDLPTLDLPKAIADSTQIFHFLEAYQPDPPLTLGVPQLDAELWAIEDWFDESIGLASRFVYYDYRSSPAGKRIDPSLSSQLIIQIVRQRQGINAATVRLAEYRLTTAIAFLAQRWQDGYLVGDRLTAADLAAAALLSPLALIPSYRQDYPWLFERIRHVHQVCKTSLPPGLS
jgi:glutathione S-transferase